MHEARFGADDFGQMRQEGDNIVLGLALDLVDAGDVEGDIARLGPDGFGGLPGDDTEFGLRIRAWASISNQILKRVAADQIDAISGRL